MKKDIIIRQTTEADYATVYSLIQTAFLTAEHRDGNEQDFAVNLRNNEECYIPELDLVAELDGQLIGHIMFTQTYIDQDGDGRFYTLLIAPLSVLLEYRNQGVGSALMEEGLHLAKTMGYANVFLVGDPNYYQRFGFQPAHLYGIDHESIPAEYVMAKEIIAHSLEDVTGTIHM